MRSYTINMNIMKSFIAKTQRGPMKTHRLFKSGKLKKFIEKFHLTPEELQLSNSYTTVLQKLLHQVEHVRSLILKQQENKFCYILQLRGETLILEELLFLFRALSNFHHPSNPSAHVKNYYEASNE